MFKRIITFFILFLCFLQVLFPNINKYDSLKSVYYNSSGLQKLKVVYDILGMQEVEYNFSDTITAIELNNLKNYNGINFKYVVLNRGIHFLNFINNDSLSKYYNEVLNFYNFYKNKNQLNGEYEPLFKRILLFLANVNYINGDTEKMNFFLDEYKRLLSNGEMLENLGSFYTLYSYCFRRKYKIDSAIYYIKKADSVYSVLQDSSKVLRAKLDYVFLMFKKNDIKEITRTLDFIVKNDEKLVVQEKVILNLFFVSFSRLLGNVNDQIKYSKKAIYYSQIAKDTSSYLASLIWLSGAFEGNNMIDSLPELAIKFKQISKKINNKIALGYYYKLMSSVLLANGPEEKFLSISDSALIIMRSYQSPLNVAQIHLNIARFYSMKKNYQFAEIYFDSVYQSINKYQFPALRLRYYQYISECLSDKGDNKEALKYFLKYFSLYDSIQKQNIENNIERILVEFKTREKEKINTILKQKLKLEQLEKNRHNLILRVETIFFIVIFLFFLLLVLVFYLSKKNNIRTRELNNEKINRLDKEKIIFEQQKQLTEQKLSDQQNRLSVTNSFLLQQTLRTEKLIETLKSLRKHVSISGQKIILSSLSEISSLSSETNWKTFEVNFTMTYPNFMSDIVSKYPDLTINEKRLCAFTKMKLSTPEICKITFQSKHSIYILRKRLREKLGVKDNVELEDLIQKI